MNYLALDLGTKKTGVSFVDTTVGIPLPLSTIVHETPSKLIAHVSTLVKERRIESIIIGLPLLPSGKEGLQAHIVRTWAAHIQDTITIPVHFIDERYTTPKIATPADPHATAACQILQTFLERERYKGIEKMEDIDKKIK